MCRRAQLYFNKQFLMAPLAFLDSSLCARLQVNDSRSRTHCYHHSTVESAESHGGDGILEQSSIARSLAPDPILSHSAASCVPHAGNHVDHNDHIFFSDPGARSGIGWPPTMPLPNTVWVLLPRRPFSSPDMFLFTNILRIAHLS